MTVAGQASPRAEPALCFSGARRKHFDTEFTGDTEPSHLTEGDGAVTSAGNFGPL